MDIAEIDYVLGACDEDQLVEFVSSWERIYSVQIVQHPTLCMTLLQATDSVEAQSFYLGEAITMKCEVIIGNCIGYGLLLGDQARRVYCLAVLDAILQCNDHNSATILAWIQEQQQLIEQREQIEHMQIIQTRVDFKLMEEG